MSRTDRLRRRSRRLAQRGAVMVEMVIVVPVLAVIILGMIEIAGAWSNNQTVVQAARSGARTVSQLGTTGVADQQGVLAVAATFGADADRITRIVIFDATATGGQLPAGCDTFGTPTISTCNVYLPADIAAAATASHFDQNGTSAGCGSGRSSNWCPDGARSDVQTSATEVGVFVEFEAEWSTGFFGGGTYTISETTVMRLEPR